jgi:hypothetical protein
VLARDCRGVTEDLTEVVDGVVVQAPEPAKDCRVVLVTAFFGAGGGAIDGRPVVLSRDFALESEVLVVVAGVPVRGVEVAELAEDTALVGDLVGDCSVVSKSAQINDPVYAPAAMASRPP